MANSVFKAFTQHCQIIVVNRALMNIIKCCFVGVLTSPLRYPIIPEGELHIFRSQRTVTLQ